MSGKKKGDTGKEVIFKFTNKKLVIESIIFSFKLNIHLGSLKQNTMRDWAHSTDELLGNLLNIHP